MSNRIEQIIENIYEFVESCKPAPLSQSKIVVPRDELYELLDELRVKTPDEIKRYQKIINNRDAIIKDAEEKAAEIIEEARRNAEALLNENSIFQQACAKANELVTEAATNKERIESAANRDADQIRGGSLAYADELLYTVERTLALCYEGVQARCEAMLGEIREKLDTVIENRKSLYPEGMEPETSYVVEDASGEGGDEEPFSGDYDPNVFMENIEE